MNMHKKSISVVTTLCAVFFLTATILFVPPRALAQNASPCVVKDREIIVGPPGSPNLCQSVQDAVNAVTEPGTYIRIEKGTYTSTLPLNITSKPSMFIECDCNVEDRGVKLSFPSIYIERTPILISGLDISINLKGVYFKNVDSAELAYLVVENKTGDAITLDTTNNVSIFGSTIKTAYGSGIQLNHAMNTVVAGNTISGSVNGIHLSYSDAHIERNLIVANTKTGIYMEQNNVVEITSNTLVKNGPTALVAITQSGKDLVRSKIAIRKNIIVNNSSSYNSSGYTAGIIISDPSTIDLTLTDNDVWQNGSSNYKGVPDPTGKDGNVSVDPKFANETTYCLDPSSPLISGTGADRTYLGYRALCNEPPPPLPTSMILTPAPTLPPNTITPTVPLEPATCVCKSDDTCDSSCLYNATPSGALKCSRESVIGPTPDQAAKDTYCKRYYRTAGDVDGSNTIDDADYFYYVRVVNGGTVPAEINADVNGDGVVSPSDREIIANALKNIPVPTQIPAPTSITVTPAPTATTAPGEPTPTPTSSLKACGTVCKSDTECAPSAPHCVRYSNSFNSYGIKKCSTSASYAKCPPSPTPTRIPTPTRAPTIPVPTGTKACGTACTSAAECAPSAPHCTRSLGSQSSKKCSTSALFATCARSTLSSDFKFPFPSQFPTFGPLPQGINVQSPTINILAATIQPDSRSGQFLLTVTTRQSSTAGFGVQLYDTNGTAWGSPLMLSQTSSPLVSQGYLVNKAPPSQCNIVQSCMISLIVADSATGAQSAGYSVQLPQVQ